MEALSPGERVTVCTGRAERHAYIDVVDEGPGLDAEAESNLFRPFSTTKGPAGTGLGLAVSLRLARTLGGDLVHVPSSSGVRWRLTLPRVETL
jgi:C4-dicarboxylate-specific signal transduction histidine kinase